MELPWQVWDLGCWSAVWGWQVIVSLGPEGRTVVGNDRAHEVCAKPEPLKQELGLSLTRRLSGEFSIVKRMWVLVVVVVELGKRNCKEAWLLTLPASLTDLTEEAPSKWSMQ